MDSNRIFRAIGCQACLCNGCALIGLFIASILNGLYQSGLLPNSLAWIVLLLSPLPGILAWWWWKQEYQSEKPSIAEKFYRNLALIVGISGYVAGLVHFIG